LSMDIEETARCLEALGNATRLSIFRLLVRAGEGGLPVGEIQLRSQVARSTLSHHLHRLIAVGLVTQERKGTVLICRADFPAMRQTVGFLMDECCLDMRKESAA